jgi:predicted alpha/beta hydrolase family esterase
MKTAIILHGMPDKENYYKPSGDSESNCHWLPWIQHELIIRDILAQTPEMPFPFEPSYELWKNVFKQFILNEDTILIGHSCGAAFILRYLSENNVKVGKVILVAPWIDPDQNEAPQMCNFEIDSSLQDRTSGVTIFISNDDGKHVLESADIIKFQLSNAKVISFEDKGHFCLKHMRTREFPELLNEILN